MYKKNDSSGSDNTYPLQMLKDNVHINVNDRLKDYDMGVFSKFSDINQWKRAALQHS